MINESSMVVAINMFVKKNFMSGIITRNSFADHSLQKFPMSPEYFGIKFLAEFKFMYC
jgi:hypothetical protein